MEPNSIHQIDAIEGTKQLDDESVDLVLIDPPYPFHERKGGPTARCQRWFPSFEGSEHSGWKEAYTDPTTEEEPRFFDWLDRLILELTRALKKGHYMVFFATEYFMDKVKPRFSEPLVYRKAWIWDKVTFTAGYYGRQQHEYLLIITKGKRPYKYVTDKGTILEHERPMPSNYPTEKPVSLYVDIINRLTQTSGELILDPCFGSGNSLIAASETERQYIGFDINKEAINLYRSKLSFFK